MDIEASQAADLAAKWQGSTQSTDSTQQNAANFAISRTPAVPKQKTGRAISRTPAVPKEKTGRAISKRPAVPKEKTGWAISKRPAVPKEKTGRGISRTATVPKEKTKRAISKRPAVPKEKTGRAISRTPAVPKEKTGRAVSRTPAVLKEKTGRAVSRTPAVPKEKTGRAISRTPAMPKEKTGRAISRTTEVPKGKTGTAISGSQANARKRKRTESRMFQISRTESGMLYISRTQTMPKRRTGKGPETNFETKLNIRDQPLPELKRKVKVELGENNSSEVEKRETKMDTKADKLSEYLVWLYIGIDEEDSDVYQNGTVCDQKRFLENVLGSASVPGKFAGSLTYMNAFAAELTVEGAKLLAGRKEVQKIRRTYGVQLHSTTSLDAA